ncbi:MAG TPA: hypothetical protein PLA68_00730 [Panacibacter sp.]|nr:hypothetical protein [Panacibacter sp.]
MKKLSSLLFIAACSSALFSCVKGDSTNPLLSVDQLEVGSYISFIEKTNITFNIADLDNSVVSFSVNKTGSDVDHIDMFVVQGANSDPSTWKLVKTVPYTGDGTVLSASATETATALGITFDNFDPGGSFTFYQRITTTDGRKFDVTNINSQVESNSNYNMAFRLTAYIGCPFIAPVGGTYEVIEDGWEDWGAGDIVTVEDGPGENQISLSGVYPNPDYGDPVNPIVVDIDPATGFATVPDVEYGDYGVLISCNGSGFVFSCTGTIDLNLDHFQAAGDYGVYRLVLHKIL